VSFGLDTPFSVRFSFGAGFGWAIKARRNAMSRKTDKNRNAAQDQSNTIKDPDDWTTGEEPMTGAQESYLNTLATEAGENVEEDLTKAEASKKIDELRHKTGRGES
jgi:hypothetical protein